MSDAPSQWQSVYPKGGEDAFIPYEAIHGRNCLITLERRPYYCDRGNYLAKLDTVTGSKLSLSIDGADLWPRYYFDYERAKLEIEAWLKKRDQWIPGPATEQREAEPMQMIALLVDGHIVLAMPDRKSDPFLDFVHQQIAEGDAISKSLSALGKSAVLMRFRAVETLQRLQANQKETSE